MTQPRMLRSMNDLVTVIIPVHNRPELLERAVRSALAQTYRPIEIIIVDDGSTDTTPARIAELESQHREISSIRQANGGPGAAREAGRLAARGAFLQYLDSDDTLLPEKIASQVHAFGQDPRAGVAYGRTRYRDSGGNEIECTWKDHLAGETTIFPHFLVDRRWETVTPLYRAAVCEEAGPWLPLRLEEDWEYDCRIGARGTRLVFVDAILCEHRDDAPDRLSRGAALDAKRLRHRARAHESIYASALRGGVSREAPEMQRFARELFLLSRQCGAAGLGDEARSLFRLARDASGDAAGRLQFRLYSAIARTIGWKNAGRLACLSDRLR